MTIPEERNKERIALEKINETNAKFWALKAREQERLMNNPALVESAMARVQSEFRRGVSVRNQISFEVALFEADGDRRRVARQSGRLGGKARKDDPLQEIVSRIVRETPKITCAELQRKLAQMQQPGGPIEDVDDDSISFVNAKGRGYTAKISGLKDRLSRARQNLKSNN